MLETWVLCLGWEDSPGVGNGNRVQFSCLENFVDRGARQATLCVVTNSQKRVSN